MIRPKHPHAIAKRFFEEEYGSTEVTYAPIGAGEIVTTGESVRMIRPKHPHAIAKRLFEEEYGSTEVTYALVGVGEVVTTGEGVRMIRPKDPLAIAHGLLKGLSSGLIKVETLLGAGRCFESGDSLGGGQRLREEVDRKVQRRISLVRRAQPIDRTEGRSNFIADLDRHIGKSHAVISCDVERGHTPASQLCSERSH